MLNLKEIPREIKVPRMEGEEDGVIQTEESSIQL